MTPYQALSFVLAFWEAVEETEEAMADELSAYGEDFWQLAIDYAQSVLDDHESWTADWIKRAETVLELIA